MSVELIIFLIAVAVYFPLAVVLLYVWWKHGKDESGVAKARSVFLVGSALLLLFMMSI